MFTAAFFITAKRWKQPKCPSTDEWINKLWSIHTMEYYSAIKRDEVLIPGWTSENIMVSERSQTPKDHIVYNSIYMKNPEKANPETKVRFMVARG